MGKQGDNETLRFNGFSGYYGQIPNGYGGFNWEDMYYFNNGRAAGQHDHDAGYRHPIAGRGEAGLGSAESGMIVSASPSETFTLKSMLAESGAASGDPVMFISYTYSNGEFVQKAADFTYITSQSRRIDFATLGSKGDFQNISAVFMLVGSGSYGMDYGHAGIANGLAFDNLKVHWNGRDSITGSSAHHAITSHSLFANMAAAPAEHHPHSANAGLHFDAGHPGGALAEHPAVAQPEHFGP